MRCIVHLDMDCFYAQVEAVRLGIDCRTEPYILSQWGNLIAVNYPARRCGIARFNTVVEAREKCPQVKVSHVATYAMGEAEYKYHENPQKRTHKVALEPYREASRKIFNILQSFEGVEVEKGSVDEAYLDVTLAAQKELKAVGILTSHRLLSLEDILHPETNVVPDRREEIDAWFQDKGKRLCDVFDTALHPEGNLEHQLLLGAASRVVWNMRERIYQELHYDCSAGIAHNKVLAKSISSRHKPNQQTLLLPDRIASAMWDVPYHSIRGLGGKFGELVRRACGEVELCREAWLVSLETLRAALGNDDAEYAYHRLRGSGEAKITARSISKTLMASKCFKPLTSSTEEVRKWVTVLCAELSARYRDFCEVNNAKGHTFNIKLGNKGLNQLGGVANKTLTLPAVVTAETLIATAMQYVTGIFSGHPGVTVNAVTLTIGSFKGESDEDGVRHGQQMRLTNFFPLKGAEKRQRDDSKVVGVLNFSSLAPTDVVPEEKDSDNDVIIIE